MDHLTANKQLATLITRAFSMDLRSKFIWGLDKLGIAWNQISEFNILTGAGLISAKLTWYDGAISIILVHGGFIISPSLFWLTDCRYTILYAHEFLIFISIVVLSQIITEHFLLSHVVPTICCGWLIINRKILKDS